MRATTWEFKNRSLISGLIFGAAFQFYFLDRQIAPTPVAVWLGAKLGISDELVIRWLFGLAALLIFAAAFVRTWASAYLKAAVVYASEVKTASLVADGPYRHVRNPLYFANVLLAIGMGAMAGRPGFVFAVVAMVVFCYRLILREEAKQGEQYHRYRDAVPRLLPALSARVPSAGATANWKQGFMTELWYWGFGVAVLVFAFTLTVKWFFVILGVSIALFWMSSIILQKRSKSQKA
ncbi:MAG TPA: methyltransferase [Candidatus Angelobacter sp.]